MLGAVALVLVAGIFFLWGNKYALDTLRITQVTPDQMLQAMNADNFYGLWRESTLLVSGTVAGISQQNGDTLIQFTSSISKAYCDIGSATTSLTVGDSIRALAEGEIAKRIPEGIMLVGCKVL